MANYTVTYRAMYSKAGDNGIPIYLKFKIRGQKPKMKHAEVFIERAEQWDDTKKKIVKNPNARQLNDLLDSKKLELSRQLLEDRLLGKPITTTSHKKRNVITSFFDYIKAVRSKNKKTIHVSGKTRNVINNIKEYHGSEPSIHEINAEWLREYETYLVEDLGYLPNSVNSIFKVLRRVTNQAALEKHIKDKVIGKGYYPMPAPGKTTPVFLIKEEREKLLQGLLNNKIENLSKRRTLLYFMLSCYSGLRFCDLPGFKFEQHVIGDIYNQEATKNTLALRATKNNELVVLPITYGSSLWQILKLIHEAGPLRKDYKAYRKELKEITEFFEMKKRVTPHVGRHSFGRLCAEQEVSIFDCAYYMGIGVKVCEIYFHLTGEMRNERNKEKLAA